MARVRDTDEGVCKEICCKEEVIAKTKAALPPEQEVMELAEAFGVLSHKTRLKMLLALAQGELCVCDVAHVVGLSLSATSHQLKTLRQHKLVSYRNDGRMAYYSLNGKGNEVLSLVQGVRSRPK